MLLLLIMPLSTSVLAQPQNEDTEPLSASASFSKAGPHAGLWIAYLAPDGDLSVRVSHGQGDGQTTSQYFPHKERIVLLRRAIDEARFFQLKKEIVPATPQEFHRPHYRLTVTLGAKQYSVAVDDPEKIGKTNEVKRFFIVWDALFSKLPFKPEIDDVR